MLIGLAPYAEEDGILHRSNCGRDVLLTGIMLGLDWYLYDFTCLYHKR